MLWPSAQSCSLQWSVSAKMEDALSLGLVHCGKTLARLNIMGL